MANTEAFLLFKEKKLIINVFTEEEIKRMLNTFKGNKFLPIRDKGILCVLVDCGIRCTELLNLKLNDISDNYITIREPKNRKDRIVSNKSLYKESNCKILKYREDKNDVLVASNTASLLENTQNIANLGTTKAPLASPNFTGTPTISGETIATTESQILTLLNGWVIDRTGSDLKVARSGTITNGTSLAILPSQYRPIGVVGWSGNQNNALVNGDLLSTGEIRIFNFASNSAFEINITFALGV